MSSIHKQTKKAYMIYVIIGYLLIGVAVYAFTDTMNFARRISDLLVVIPLGVIQKNLFLFVVVLWPIWLVVRRTISE